MPVTYKTMVLEVLQVLRRPAGASLAAIRTQCGKTYDRDFAAGIVDWRLKRALQQLVQANKIRTHPRHRRSYVLVGDGKCVPTQ